MSKGPSTAGGGTPQFNSSALGGLGGLFSGFSQAPASYQDPAPAPTAPGMGNPAAVAALEGNTGARFVHQGQFLDTGGSGWHHGGGWMDGGGGGGGPPTPTPTPTPTPSPTPTPVPDPSQTPPPPSPTTIGDQIGDPARWAQYVQSGYYAGLDPVAQSSLRHVLGLG